MRTAELELGGVKYPLCLSTRVMMHIEDRGETLSTIAQKIDENSPTTRAWLLAELMRAGYIFAQSEGGEPPESLSEDWIADNTCPADFPAINSAIIEAIKNGTNPTVEVKPPKKGRGATQAE